jgi:hypothetical protein
LNY